jgi:DNA-binding PadR family transcriptional regulator
MAILHLTQSHDDAFGSAIRDDIERRSGRKVSRGSIYVTLDRLEDKGYLASRLATSAQARAGQPKRLFRVTPLGVRAVKHSVSLVVRMHQGLEPVLGD